MMEFEIPLLSDASRQAVGATFSKTHVNELVEGKCAVCGDDYSLQIFVGCALIREIQP